MIVTIQDIRDAGYCVSGTRKWFAHQGLDFRDFLLNGIPVKTLEQTNDAMALDVTARKRAGAV